MDKINFEFFDFFGAVLPGIPLLIMSCFIVNGVPFSFDAVAVFLKSASLSQMSAIVIVCYCIGFCIHYPAYELFQPLMKMWGKKRTKGLPISIGKRERELVSIRHKSAENFKLINKFLALRQMAYSMFFSLLLSAILLVGFALYEARWPRDITSTVIISFLFSFLFLRRAVAFHQRIQEMITETSAIP